MESIYEYEEEMDGRADYYHPVLIVPVLAAAGDEAKEQERVKESGNVMTELLNSSNGVPISVLNKAECVIVIPSMKKAGFAEDDLTDLRPASCFRIVDEPHFH